MARDIASIFAFNPAAQTPTTTPAKLIGLTNTGQFTDPADLSVEPDPANNRILAASPIPGPNVGPTAGPAQYTAYRVSFFASISCAVAGILRFTVRKGGVVSGGATPDMQAQVQFGAAADIRDVCLTGTLKVFATDAGLIQAAAVQPAGISNPTQQGSLFQMPIEVYVESTIAGGQAMTMLNGTLLVEPITGD
jgi:hypothetical protein